MTRDPRYDVLFEPVKIGPVTTRNRFYQVPHCNGMGYAYPSSMAEMRRIKAEGGWSVACAEEVEVYHTAEHSPFIKGRFRDDSDIPTLARMCENLHKHGGLAGGRIPPGPGPGDGQGRHQGSARRHLRRGIPLRCR